jgi:hypothetical protein
MEDQIGWSREVSDLRGSSSQRISLVPIVTEASPKRV